MARLLSEEGVLREIHPLLLYYGIGEEMSREKKVEYCRKGLGEGGSIFLARELHLPEGSSEILDPYLNDIPTIERVWREAPELGLVIFQEIDSLRKQLKKQGSFFDDFLQPIQLMHYFYGQIEQEKRRYQKKA